MSYRRFGAVMLQIALACFVISTLALAQSITTGSVTGTVTDPSGAVLPNVHLTLKNLEKGFTQAADSTATGQYRFSLLQPGSYTLSATSQGFRTAKVAVTVAVGATLVRNVQMEVGTTGTTVEVTGEVPLLQTDSSEIATTINQLAVQNLPNPGNDLSFIAQTAPGSVMNTQSGYGNFSSYGISATSNLFTLDGMYDNDPFLNLNNSGATNLLLGNNEVQEANVVSNGYSGEYGGFAGAQVNYVTKSGTNDFHGNANYQWNGRAMNANDWFNKNVPKGTPVTPRSFDNANQYSASFGGPIKKDKAFFFVDYEGLRVVLPTSNQVLVPSPAFETNSLAYLAANGLSQSIPFYQNMYTLYNGAPGINRAIPGVQNAADTTGCAGQTFTGPAGPLGGAAGPCALNFRSTVGQLTHEFLAAGRFDFNLGNNDHMFLRVQEDKGLQASYTDPVNPVFNAISDQPEYQTQLSENHTFGARAVNNVVFSAQFYQAIFNNPDRAAAVSTFPGNVFLGDGSFSNMGGLDIIWPQGRNVTGYQVVDDFSYVLSSKHNLKFGANFHRNDISDHDFSFFTAPEIVPITIGDFFAGGNGPVGTFFEQSFPTRLEQPIALYQLGWYVQDEWRVAPSFKLTLAVRFDHNSIPACLTNCFAHLSGQFQDISHDVNAPYNQVIQTGLNRALPSFTKVAVQPRIGFSWQPFGLTHTVLRGGVGLFMDTFPGQIADILAGNPPGVNTFFAFGNNLANTQIAGTGNEWIDTATSNSAFRSGFASGGTLASIAAAAGPAFSPPTMTNVTNIVAPVYQEWNFEVQQGLGNNTSININYVGNHGIHETAISPNVNAFCPASVCAFGFAGLPSAPPDPRFSTVTQVNTVAVSNYNGLTVSAQHRLAHGLQIQGSYTWSHALDEISNGGFNPFNFGTNTSVLSVLNPNNLRQYNYGNADYDIRHYLNLSYVYEVPKGPTPLLKGWQVSGTLFHRTGLPFSVIDTATSNTLSSFNFGSNTGQLALANYNGTGFPSCGSPTSSCPKASDFSSPIGLAATGPSGWGAQRRDQFRGPGYFDTDLTLLKKTKIPGWERAQIAVGAQFFNILNHPNFDQPVNDISNSQFGSIIRTVNTPTSILGSFLGGDASPRLIQLIAKFEF